MMPEPMTDEQLAKFRERVEHASDCWVGMTCEETRDLLAEVERLRTELRLAFPPRLYLEIQKVLDASLGPQEADGAGEGIVADVALLADQRDAARAELFAYREEANRAFRAQAAAPISVKATGFGKTVIGATGETTLNIKAGDRRIHIDLGTEFAEPMAVLLLDDPEHSDESLGDPAGSLPAAYVNSDSAYRTLHHEDCDGFVAFIDAGDTLAGLIAKLRAHVCETAGGGE